MVESYDHILDHLNTNVDFHCQRTLLRQFPYHTNDDGVTKRPLCNAPTPYFGSFARVEAKELSESCISSMAKLSYKAKLCFIEIILNRATFADIKLVQPENGCLASSPFNLRPLRREKTQSQVQCLITWVRLLTFQTH